MLIILSTSSIQTYSGNTRLLIAGIRFSDIVYFLCAGCSFKDTKTKQYTNMYLFLIYPYSLFNF